MLPCSNARPVLGLGKLPECGQSSRGTFSKDDEGRGTEQHVLFGIQCLVRDEEKAYSMHGKGSYFPFSHCQAIETESAFGSWQQHVGERANLQACWRVEAGQLKPDLTLLSPEFE